MKSEGGGNGQLGKRTGNQEQKVLNGGGQRRKGS